MDESKKHKHNDDDNSMVANTFRFFERIPTELESMILIRLPVASLLRSKCVCKSWLSLIESPDFISQHTDRDDNGLIVMHDSTPHGFAILPDFKQVVFSPEDADADEVYNRSLASSFDGIVCIVFSKMINEKNVQFASLWNPAMKQSIFLPLSPESKLDENDHWQTISYGFGLDVERNAYKLVKFVVRSYVKSRLNTLAVVYDLKTDTWKVIGDVVPRNFQVTSNPKRPFQKSIYCWLGFDQIDGDDLILTYDFSKESFGIITVPEFDKDAELDPILTFLNEKIAFVNWVIDDAENDLYNVWVLGDYRVVEWTRLYTVTLDRARQPLGFSADGTLILLNEESYDDVARNTLFFYEPLTEQGNVVGTPREVCDVALYKESMVSVKTSLTLQKRTVYERFLKAVHGFQIFGYAKLPKQVFRPPADDDVLQKEISRLEELVRDKEKTIKKQKEDLSKVKDELDELLRKKTI